MSMSMSKMPDFDKNHPQVILSRPQVIQSGNLKSYASSSSSVAEVSSGALSKSLETGITPKRQFNFSITANELDDESNPECRVDLQEVGVDTSDLKPLRGRRPFVLNFSRVGADVKSLNLHFGVRRERKHEVHLHDRTRLGIPNTDDYSHEVLRYIRTLQGLKELQFVIEIHVDDNKVYYKTFDEDETKINEAPPPPFGRLSSTGDNGFSTCRLLPMVCSSSYINITSFPDTLTKIHVELPGLTSSYLGDWKHFFERQNSLQCLICNFGSILWTFYANTIVNNQETLERIVLRNVLSYDIDDGEDVPLDFAVFENCTQLGYLKITSGGYRGVDRWSEWQAVGHPPSPGEILIHTNFLKMYTDNLVELHFSHFQIDTNKLEQLVKKCHGRKLRHICRDCPDREYYDEDYRFVVQDKKFSQNKYKIDAGADVELKMLLAGYTSNQKRIFKEMDPKEKAERRQNIIMFIVLLIFMAGIMAAISVFVVAVIK